MKKTLLLVAILFSVNVLNAQEMFLGLTWEGGEYGTGALIKMNVDGSELGVLHSFESIAGHSAARVELIEMGGMLYGLAAGGGANHVGVLFRYDPSTGNYQVVHNFQGETTGAYPSGCLVNGGNGKLYGLTTAGGAHQQGVLFEFDPLENKVIQKMSFDGVNGASPSGKMVLAADGKLYGATSQGGESNEGVLFSFDPVTGVFIKKPEFSAASSGAHPTGELVITDGMVFGMCSTGGSHSAGTIFQYNLNTNDLLKRYDFDGSETGRSPYGGLTEVEGSVLYGMTSAGGTSDHGILFSFDPASGVFTKRIDFDGPTKGSVPFGSLLYAQDKKLYGVTEQGLEGFGGFFSFDPAGGAFRILKTYNGMLTGPGGYSRTTPMQAHDNIIYGTTSIGGDGYSGTLFSYNPVSAVYNVEISFGAAKDGQRPMGQLVYGPYGRVYGVAYMGGPYQDGTIFEYDLSKNEFVKKVDLTNDLGGNVWGGLMEAKNGNLLGLGRYGGDFESGTLFEYIPGADTYTKIFDFPTHAANPAGVVLEAENGVLYGATENGGENNGGTLFSYDPSSGIFKTLVNFDWAEKGGKPTGFLLLENGRLYGLASEGGVQNAGLLFSYDLNSGSYEILVHFNEYSSGTSPVGGLVKGPDGKFYGVSRFTAGGSGAIFRFDPIDNAMEVAYGFMDSDGGEVGGPLILSPNGKFYGTLSQGGIKNLGIIFEFDPLTGAFEKKHEFTGTNGARPHRLHFALISHGAGPSLEDHLTYVQTAEGLQETIGAYVHGDNPLTIEWKKDGNIIYDATSSLYRIEEVALADSGIYTLTVSNAHGIKTTNIEVHVMQNTAPTVELREPKAGATFTPGHDIAFRGYASDRETGIDVDHQWRLEYHQAGKVSPGPAVAHQEWGGEGVSSGHFSIPENLEPSTGDFYRLYFSAQDHRGLSACQSIDIPWSGAAPAGPTLTFKTNPEGLAITVDDSLVHSMYNTVSVPGSLRTVEVISPQTVDGVSYSFSNWAHGGQPNQSITTPEGNTTYTVNFSAPLVGPWRTTDVGAVNISGGASFSNGMYTLRGSGKDIWEKSDAFRFVYRSIDGDVDIRARVVGLTNTHYWAKAGVMIRNSADPASKHVMTAITPRNGASFQRRIEPSKLTLATNAAAAAPHWVRLTRFGDTFTSYISTDGITWTMIGEPVVLSMYKRVLVGMVVTSHTLDSALCEAEFTDVSVLIPGATSSAATTPELVEELTAFDVYPNPLSGNMLYVRLRDPGSDYTLQIISPLGQVYYQKRVDRNKEDQVEIDMSSFQKGVYILRLTGPRTAQSRSIIRQ